MPHSLSTMERAKNAWRKIIPVWYEFHHLRFTRNRLWADLPALRRHLPAQCLTLATPPLFYVRHGAGPIPRVLRMEPVAGGAEDSRYPLDGLVCSIERLGKAVRLSVSGELDLAAVPAFVGYLGRASETTPNVIVDLRGPKYIDSAGINTLLDAHQRFQRAGRRIVLAAPSEMMTRILKIVSVEQVVPTYATMEEALRSFEDLNPRSPA
ncbi:MAG TPA: STAS domain-containing protein [bacterium]|nr:STAS domain-containing protein [bacterium]